MCGICGFVGNFPGIHNVFFGIEMLLNRGYDSSGICGIRNNRFLIHKYASTVKRTSISLLNDHKNEYENLISPLIMHTRWATCGPKTDINSHPHTDHTNKFSLVHNGIIDNYLQLKKLLIEKYHVTFQTETDTEVVVNLISVMYYQEKNVEIAIAKSLKLLEGTWAICLMSLYEPNKIYCFCREMPLLIGYGDHFMMLASEQSAFYKFVDTYSYLNNDEIGCLEYKDNNVFFNLSDLCPVYPVARMNIETSPFPYEHWTLKEIYDQPDAVKNALEGRINLKSNTVELEELNPYINTLTNVVNHLILLGCGTSKHACLYVAELFKRISNLTTVQVFDGAEFDESDIAHDGTTMFIFVSQSGETRDLYQCVEIGQRRGIFMLGVINVVDSLISRKMNTTIYLRCGRENAVASTKAFTNQVVVLSLIALWLGEIRSPLSKTQPHSSDQIIYLLYNLPDRLRQTIENTTIGAKMIAEELTQSFSLFVLGKGTSEVICQEGSLKIKEIGYIHSEAFNSSALKHGPFSLLANNIPVIMIITSDKYYAKNIGVLDEILSRTEHVFAITSCDVTQHFDHKCTSKSKSDRIIEIMDYEMFTSLLAIIPLQLIAYYIALLKDTNPDKPINLAKVITV